MKIKLGRREINLLHRVVCQPESVALPRNPTQPHPPYEASDRTGAKMLSKLIKVIRTKIMVETGPNQWEIPERWEGGIKQTFADKLLEIMIHYSALGMSSTWVQEYWTIRDQLEGKRMDADDISEVLDDEDGEEEEEEEEEEGSGQEKSE